MTAKQCALRDMKACKIQTNYIYMEKELLEYLSGDKNIKRPDFRAFNGKLDSLNCL